MASANPWCDLIICDLKGRWSLPKMYFFCLFSVELPPGHEKVRNGAKCKSAKRVETVTLTWSPWTKTDLVNLRRILNPQKQVRPVSVFGCETRTPFDQLGQRWVGKHWSRFTRITQRGRNNRRGGSQSENTVSLKTYLATALHIRPPWSLSAFQQWQHCQKTQKQAVHYHCCSHGNRPAEGAPALTLICKNTIKPPTQHTVGEGGGHSWGELCHQCERLEGPACEKCR